MRDDALANPFRGRSLALGLFSVFVGLFLVGAYFTNPRLHASGNSLLFVVYVGVGGLLLLLGARILLGGVFARWSRWRGHGITRWYRASMPVPALAYLGILFVLLVASMMGRASQAASNMLLLVFGMMAGPFVANGSITFMMLRRAEARRTLPPRAVVGEPVAIDIELRNYGKLFSSWMMTVRDTLNGPTGQQQGMVLFTRVGRRASRRAPYLVEFGRRGKYRLGPISISSRFPLGLIERAVVLEDYRDLIVFPRIGQVTHDWRDRRTDQADLVHQPRADRGAHDDEFHALREFRAGDASRSIHWRTSARRNELMIREFEQRRRSHLVLVVDVHLPKGSSAADRQTLERGISAAATLVVDQARHAPDSRIALAILGKEPVLLAGTALAAAVDEMLTALALTEPHTGDAGEQVARRDAVLRDLLEATAPGARGVVVSPRAADPFERVDPARLAAAGVRFERLDLEPERLAKWMIL